MSESNKTTIQSYEGNIDAYVERTPQVVSGDVKIWIDRALEGLAENSKILEIGSGFGRDADYIESEGFTVDRTDATAGFVNLLQQNGKEARLLNALVDDLGSRNDLIFADAVLLHFSRDETRSVCKKVYESLSPNGKFALSLKQGEGEEWSDEKLGAARYFCYWTDSKIRQALSDVGFMNIESNSGESTREKAPKWLHIIAKK